MGRKTKLNDFERGRIFELNRMGVSIKKISKIIGRSRNAISSCIKNKNSVTSSPGRPQKITPSLSRRILKVVKRNTSISSQKIKDETGANCSPLTIRRHLKSKGYVNKKRVCRPLLLQRHKEKRMIYAKKYQTWDAIKWGTVIFSDEKRFNLDGPDGFKNYWHDKSLKEEFFSKRHSGGGSIMVWGAFGLGGTLDLQIIESNLNAKNYQELLKRSLLNKNAR